MIIKKYQVREFIYLFVDQIFELLFMINFCFKNLLGLVVYQNAIVLLMTGLKFILIKSLRFFVNFV